MENASGIHRPVQAVSGLWQQELATLAPQEFQHQAHEHLLKEKERRHNAFARTCHYLLENPLQAELLKHSDEWPFSGVVVPGYPTLHPLQDDFWPKFWKLYNASKSPDAGKSIRPPIT